MSRNRLTGLRVSLVVLLVLLFVQYEFGMVINFASPPPLPAFSLSDGDAFNSALNAAGGLAQPHSILGFLIWLLAVVTAVWSFRVAPSRVKVLAVLALLSVSAAGAGGTLFVSSGFANDSASQVMAAGFVLAYTFVFLELYFLRGETGSRPATLREP